MRTKSSSCFGLSLSLLGLPLVALALAGAGCTESGTDPDEDAAPEDVAKAEEEIYTYASFPHTLRVGVVLYDFQAAGSNPPPGTHRLPLADVLNVTFNGTGHDASTGSASRYWYEATDNWVQFTGAVFDWVTLPRRDHVWRHTAPVGGPTCQGGEPSQSLAGQYFCYDPLQPASNTWLYGPVASNAACPSGSPSAQPFIPAGSDWCNDLTVIGADLIPTIQQAAANAPGVTNTGAAITGFHAADYDVVIYASPYSVQGVYVGGKNIITEARDRGYAGYAFPHEIGHFLGLQHAQGYVCGPAGSRVSWSPSASCFVKMQNGGDYSDPSSLMAVQTYQISGYEKLASGAISTSSLQTITTSGRYSISAEELPYMSRVLRVASGSTYPGTTYPAYYYVDIRQPLLFDAGMGANSPFVKGVAVHLAPDYAQQVYLNGSESTLCGAGCPGYNAAFSPKLLDMTPWTDSDFSDAPLAQGASFTETTQGITMQVASRDANGATVDVTFRPTNNKLLFYYPPGGGLQDYAQFPAGGMTFVSQAFGFSPGWTHVVGGNNGGLLFYNQATGAAYATYIDDAYVYHAVSPLSLGAGWTHVTTAGRGNYLFYRASTGEHMTATLSPTGVFTQKATGNGLDTNLTTVTGSLNGGVVFYKSSTGALSTAKLDAAGTLTNLRSIPAVATGFNNITAVRENALVLYNRTTGAVRTAALDDQGNVQLKASQTWATYTQIVGGLNGALFLYRGTDGFSYNVTMDASYNLHWIGVVGGIAPGQIVTTAGGV